MSNDNKVEVISAIVIDTPSDLTTNNNTSLIPVRSAEYSGDNREVYIAIVNGYLRLIKTIGEKRLVSEENVTSNIIVDYVSTGNGFDNILEKLNQPEQPDETITNLSARVDSLSSKLSEVATVVDVLTKKLSRIESSLEALDRIEGWRNPRHNTSPMFTDRKSSPIPHRLMTDEEAGEWLTAYKEGLK